MNSAGKSLVSFDDFLNKKCNSIREQTQHIKNVAEGRGIGGLFLRVATNLVGIINGDNVYGDSARNYVYLYNGLRLMGALMALSSVLLVPLVYSAGICLTFLGWTRSWEFDPNVERPSPDLLLLQIVSLPATLLFSGIFIAICPVNGIDCALKILPTTPWLLEQICGAISQWS